MTYNEEEHTIIVDKNGRAIKINDARLGHPINTDLKDATTFILTTEAGMFVRVLNQRFPSQGFEQRTLELKLRVNR